MLDAHAPPLSPSLASRPPLRSNSRLALADSTNVHSRLNACGLDYSRGFTASTRKSCGWNEFESSPGSISAACHARLHHVFSTPALLPATYKAPPTVSISLSAACSRNITGERDCGSRRLGLEPDLPDVGSVVPFPSAPLDGDMDVDMLDGTCTPRPDGHLLFVGQAPRKRRSAHSSASSSQGNLGKDAKQKRPRKSRRHVAELWWLGVVHRSIARGIEVRQSVGQLDDSDRSPSRQCDFDAMDRALVEKIQKRLAENGCAEGRVLPIPIPRVPSPSITPSLVLLAPGRKTPPIESTPITLSSELNPKEKIILDGTTIPSPAFKAPPCVSLSNTSHFLVPSSRSSHRRNAHFQRPCQVQPRSSIHSRSLSPPARTATISSNGPLLTLTMSQLVASLTLAYHDRSGLRSRGRTYKVTACGNNPARFQPSVPCRAVQRNDDDTTHDKEGSHQPFTPRTRLSCTPDRKSPLSRVAYAES